MQNFDASHANFGCAGLEDTRGNAGIAPRNHGILEIPIFWARMQPTLSPPAIEFRDVSYEVDGTHVLRSLTLQVQRGEILALLGRSGSGKTTTLKLVNRLLSPTSGEVRVNDAPNIN